MLTHNEVEKLEIENFLKFLAEEEGYICDCEQRQRLRDRLKDLTQETQQ